MKSTIIFFAICFFISSTSLADRFVMMRDTGATSVDSIEFAINGRPVVASMLGVGSFGGVGPVSEWIKAGTNVLSITVAEKASAEVREKHPDLTDEKESARVKLLFRRYSESGEMAEEQIVVNETFQTIPTNFVFTVPDSWPIKELVWEGKTPTITAKDKSEILGILQAVADAYASYEKASSVKNLLRLERLVNEHDACLEGMPIAALEKENVEAIKEMADNLSKEKILFRGVEIQTFPGLNLVRISVKNENPKFGTTPYVAHWKDGSGSLIGPEWFSKIDGKWWIVP